jgi:hypothetical protein
MKYFYFPTHTDKNSIFLKLNSFKTGKLLADRNFFPQRPNFLHGKSWQHWSPCRLSHRHGLQLDTEACGKNVEPEENPHLAGGYTDKKGNNIFLIYKEIQMGSGAKSYMRKGFLIYEEMLKFFPIYEEAVTAR